MIKKILFLVLAVALLSPLPSLASGYLGASIGNTWQSATVTSSDLSDQAMDISENSTGWKMFGGYKSQGIFGLEGGYRDLGMIESQDSGLNFEADTSGWDIEAMLHFEVSIFDLFAKAGAFFWDTTAGVTDYVGEDSGTSFLWGLGAGVSLGTIGFRLEYEAMDVENMDNLSMLSLGVTFGF